MHFVPVIEKVKYNLHSGPLAMKNAYRSELWRKVMGRIWTSLSCQDADSHSNVTRLNCTSIIQRSVDCTGSKSVDNISILQREVNRRDLVTEGTGTGGGGGNKSNGIYI